MIKSSFLFGPFIGETSWEMFRFAPYAIFKKKTNPNKLIIVLSREERIDFYGSYCDIFVPLRLKSNVEPKYFSATNIEKFDYETLAKSFYLQFEKKTKIEGHFYPRIESGFHKLKWQFPRYEMDYDFKPRFRNNIIVNSFLDKNKRNILIDFDSFKTTNQINNFLKKINSFEMFNNFNFIVNNTKFLDLPISNEFLKLSNLNSEIIINQSSFYGCLIYILKRCIFTIGNIFSVVPHLSLLLKVPVYNNIRYLEDEASLINPQETKIYDLKKLKKETLQFYLEGKKNEDSF